MNARLVLRALLFFVLALASVSSVTAQEPTPPTAPPVEWGQRLPFDIQRRLAAASQVTDTLEPTAIGQPGLSFRYLKTFGVTEEPYLVDNQHLNVPVGLFIDASDNVYVVELRGFRLLKYDPAGTNTLVIGHAGQPWHHDDFLHYPRDVAVRASDGHIWVTIGTAIKEFEAGGNLVQIFPATDPWASGSGNDRFDGAGGIAFDGAGRMFVSDRNNNRVQVFTFDGSGKPVYDATISGLNRPNRIAVDSSNRLYIVDSGNNQVQRCALNGTWTCSTLDTGLNYPEGVGLDGSDNVYIADGANKRIRKCTAAGACSDFMTGLFGYADDVSVDSIGNVYVSHGGRNVIQKYDSSGAVVGAFAGVLDVPYVADATRLNQPWGVAIAPDGSIYTTEWRGYRLVKLNAAGVQQWTIGQTGVWGDDNNHFGDWWAGPEGDLALDASGRIYVPDTGNHRVQIFSPNGTFFARIGKTREPGNDNTHLECPSGVAINPSNGDILVVDGCNQRVQVFNKNRKYKATIGVTDQPGPDNKHFNGPGGIAVDTNGNILVADTENHRVQKCALTSGSSPDGYTCSTFAGKTGNPDYAFNRLSGPNGLAVDRDGRVYVADRGNHRIQVFDARGAYLTTIGGAWGANTGRLRIPSDVAIDQTGNLFVGDTENHRLQKYARGVPNWKQVNLNGFGDNRNWGWWTQTGVFGAYLYVGTTNFEQGAQLWRSPNGTDWKRVVKNGFNDAKNVQIMGMVEFGGYLYVGTRKDTTGGEIWRSADGVHWTQVNADGFGDVNNHAAEPSAVFRNFVYAGTTNGASGCEVWRSRNGTAWARVSAGGFGDAKNVACTNEKVFKGFIYAGTFNTTTGGELWRSNNGTSWTQVGGDAFGDPNNQGLSPLTVFGDYLYVGTRNLTTGVEIWRSRDGVNWQQVNSDGFGNGANEGSYGYTAAVFGSKLYVASANWTTGLGIWSTTNGTTWKRVATAGFGDSENHVATLSVFQNRLYAGTANLGHSAEVWQYQK